MSRSPVQWLFLFHLQWLVLVTARVDNVEETSKSKLDLPDALPDYC